MKARTLAAAATLALSAAIALPASAAISSGNLVQDVRTAGTSGGNVNVRLDNGVATLFGHVDSAGTRARVARAAMAHEDVDRVINLIVY